LQQRRFALAMKKTAIDALFVWRNQSNPLVVTPYFDGVTVNVLASLD
jgi:hypothetical protein